MNQARPSETSQGKLWLQNFAPRDVEYARLLVDSLYIPSTDEVRQSIKNLIKSSGEDAVQQSSLLLPVLSMEDIESALKRARGNSLTVKPRVAYEDFHPGNDISATPGSEGMVGNIIRDLTGEVPRSKNRHWLHPASTLEDLRKARPERILLVSDYAGSGTQIMDYARFLNRNATIRSWRSLKYIKIVAVLHASSAQAVESMKSSPHIDEVRVAEIAPSFASAQWTADELTEIERLCHTYAPGRQALGYKRSAGLLAMHSGISNNVPMVLRRTHSNWSPFFEGRRFPQKLADELPSYRPERDLASVATAQQQARLAAVISSGRLGTSAAQITATLALIKRGKHDVLTLASFLSLSSEKVSSILRFLEMAGMVSGSVLTELGHRELNAAKALPRRTRVSLTPNERDPYYPQNLR